MERDAEYSIRRLSAVRCAPSLLHFHNNGRTTSAFLYIVEGDYRYHTAEGEKEAKGGDAVYLPIFSRYSYEIVSAHAEVICVEFILEKEVKGGAMRGAALHVPRRFARR